MKKKNRYITLNKILPLILLFITCFLLTDYLKQSDAVTIESAAATQQILSPTIDQEKTVRALVKKLKRSHYLDETLDNTFSEKVFNNYIELLDSSKTHFLKTDIDEFSKYRYTLDDDLKGGNLESAFSIYKRYHMRREQRIKYTIGVLEKGIDAINFNKDEYIEIDRKDLPWCADLSEAQGLWLNLIKNEILNLKLEKTAVEEMQTTLLKRYKNQLRLLEQINSDDVFKYFIMAYTHSYEPHTEYFPPVESKNFDIHMRLSLEGIGAMLQSEDMYVKVVELVVGGPAERGGDLKPADRIIAVGQGNEGELTDVEGWRLDDVVNLIRGPKGTVVRLKVIPADNTDISKTKVISITRDTVKLEEQSAKKSILEIKREEKVYRVGIIKLPAFYSDFEAAMSGDANFKSSTRDVERLIYELLDEKIQGLILDLRNNGGGSLQEAKDMTGLFLTEGPVVQIRDADDDVMLYSDTDPRLVYNGPVAILVNRLSASASEILAGAIQDYGRGIVIGSQTFGKGTVQSMEPLEPGRVKYTQAKYYRINGHSTQNRGVIPDIIFPEVINKEEIGESSLPQTMAWDQIKESDYKMVSVLTPVINYLKERHMLRIKDNPEFTYLDERISFLEESRKRTRVSLNESVRLKEEEAMKQQLLEMENRRRQALGQEPYKEYAEIEKAEEEKAEREKKNGEEPDSLLNETGEILTDWLVKLAKNGVRNDNLLRN
ncbi:MAG: carboxy terminal-processing peptidase [Deltaproteobacteria bacterium]|nr:carboxy terminal-processing peptidase [Deltaproteobacteria bacterium]